MDLSNVEGNEVHILDAGHDTYIVLQKNVVLDVGEDGKLESAIDRVYTVGSFAEMIEFICEMFDVSTTDLGNALGERLKEGGW